MKQSLNSLGPNQLKVLRMLQQRKSWTPGADWVHTNTTTTIEILDTLVKRGWVDRNAVGPNAVYTIPPGMEQLQLPLEMVHATK